MLRTEQESRKAECCGPSSCGQWVPADPNNPVEGFQVRFCTASACMAWRWGVETIYANGGAHVAGHRRSKKGYCGLAGKPE